MSARPAVVLVAAAAAAVAAGLAARRRGSGPVVEPYPTPPLVQRP